jgi:hypothetical protein
LNPVTIHFHLDQAQASMAVKLYTVAFRKVLEIPLGPVSAGNHDVPVSLKGPQGETLANGVYYLQVSGLSGKPSFKLLIIR